MDLLLEAMPLAGNVNRHFLAVAQPHAGDLAKGRIRLLRGHGLDLQADPPLLRAALQNRGFAELAGLTPLLAAKLIHRRHGNNSGFLTLDTHSSYGKTLSLPNPCRLSRLAMQEHPHP